MRELAAVPVLLFLVLATATAYADDVSDTAGAVAAAVTRGDADALRKLADASRPDPWLVADELCRREAFDAAAAFARAGSRPATAKLPAYVAGRRERDANTAAVEALKRGSQALTARDPEAALAAVKDVNPDAADLVSIRATTLRAVALRSLKRFEECEAVFIAAADAAETIGWLDRARQDVHSANYSAYRRGAMERSLGLLLRETEIARAARNDKAVCQGMITTGLVLIQMAKYDDAAKILDEALVLSRKLGDGAATGRALNNQGIMHRRCGRLREALAAYEQALELARKAGDTAATASALGNVGLVQDELGDPEAALASHRGALSIHEEALTLARAVGHRLDEASILLNQGLVHQLRGDFGDALDALEAALGLYRKIESEPGEAIALANLGNVHRDLGNHARAEECMSRALELYVAQRDPSGEASVLCSLAAAHADRGQAGKARELMQRALAVRKKLGEKDQVAVAHGLLGTVSLDQGRHEQALGHFRSALLIAEEIGARELESNIHQNIGATYLRQDRPAEASDHFTRGLELAAESGRRGKGVLALGDPQYRESDAGPVASARAAAGRLSPLPSARKEAAAVGDLLLLGKNATEERLTEAIGKQPRWRAIHFACHGFVDPESPARAWLALAAEGGGISDLTCLEVYRMSIPADLVVLSACDTARGGLYRTEGVVGFTRAFLFAGSPRVVASLWKVDDEATTALMIRFYDLWKSGKVAAATALRQAQRHVASRERWKHPHFWAAWQLWGIPD